MAIHILLAICFAGIAAILAVRMWALVARFRKEDAADETVRARRGVRISGWAASPPACTVVAVICAVLVLAAARTTKHWLRNGRRTNPQQKLMLELHVLGVVPGRMYSVVAKFHVNGRPYDSARPLEIRFGTVEPVYRIPLYYDANNPARNGWAPLHAPILDAIDKILLMLMGAMVCVIFLVEAARVRRERHFVLMQTAEK